MPQARKIQKRHVLKAHPFGLTGHPAKNRQICNGFYQSRILQNPIRLRSFELKKRKLQKIYKLNDEEAHYAAVLELIKNHRLAERLGKKAAALQTL